VSYTQHPPPEVTSQQTFLEDLDYQVAAAHKAGGYTAVLKLARERRDELQREFATLTAGHELRRMTRREWEEHRRQWTPEEARVKGRLSEQIAELDWKIRQWDHVAGHAAPYAANEAHGWTILPDGTPAKVLDNGKVLTVHGGVRYEEQDGTIVDTSQRGEQWDRRNRRFAQEFGDRVRAERLSKASNRTRPPAFRLGRARERRHGATRRTASSSSTSSADPPRRPRRTRAA
jgi:hypothetical protein